MGKSLLDEALAWQTAGYAVVPVRTDGTKHPSVNWSDFADEPPTADEVRHMFTTVTTDGIGLICGKTSGNLEMFELEGRAINAGLLEQLVEHLGDNALGELWQRLNHGYVELTPAGGMHWYYRVDGPARRNTKIARRPATPEELAADPDDKVKVLVETRGEGGFTVVAPSHGRTHPSGHAWTVIAGHRYTIPTLTIDERDALHAIASMLDQMPTPLTPNGAPSSSEASGDRPGDYYNAKTSWDNLLLPAGWTKLRHFGGNCFGWRRPGKTDAGISATTGRNDGDNLFVFSSSTPFEQETPYSKFAAYAVLAHGGDYSLAAKQLWSDGYRKPEEPRPADAFEGILLPGKDGSDQASSASTEDHPATVVEPLTYSNTDDGNALRLVDVHRDAIRYCPQRGIWLRWDGYRWGWDEAESVRELARGVARALPAGDKAEVAHRARSLSEYGVRSAVRLAQTDARVVVHLGNLDANAYQLNTPAGIVDLRTGTVHGPDPAALATRSTAVAPDLTNPPTRWISFLADTFAGDPELTTYMQRLLGLSLIGTVLEQVLPFSFGSGANGKTTMLGTVQRIAGLGDNGYAISAPAEILLASSQQGHPTEIARLSGARMVVTSELEDGQRFAESRVKELTGSDVITGRFMRQDFFSFKPTHTLWLLANHQPAVRAGGPAFWRRLRLLPFLHTVPPEQRDPELEDKLVEEEGSAILGWLVQGAADYLAKGLDEPESVRAATEHYERDQDTVARFVEDCCETGDPAAQHLSVNVTPFRAAYETWCRIEGETPVTAKALTLALRTQYGVLSDRVFRGGQTHRRYLGIRISDAPGDPSDGSRDPSEEGDQWWQR